MLIKKTLPAALAAALLTSVGTVQLAQAQMEIAGNVALVTDYRFRGISQSDESMALQGGFDTSFGNGIYLGVWGSSIDFDANEGGFDGSLELDYYGGWVYQLNDSWSIDLGYMYYDYPGDNGAEGDYQEVYGKVSWEDLTVGLAYSDDYYGGTGSFYYLSADYGFTLPADFGLGLHIGYNDIEKNGGFFATNEDSYIDYSIGLSKEWASVEWALTYVGTDLKKKDVFGTDWAEDTVVFSIAKSL